MFESMSIRMLFLLISLLVVAPSILWSETQRPESLIYYDEPNTTVLIVDKSECSLNVYRFDQQWHKIDQFACTRGKKEGDKIYEGDERTPQGVYWFSNVWTSKSLLEQYGKSAEIYGIGAFELNYPNYVDSFFYKKKGYGIWLHGTDKAQPIPTRGCISTSNQDLLRISQYIEIGKTPIIVQEKIHYQSEAEVSEVAQNILTMIQTWRAAWESDDVEHYLSYYSKRFKTPKFRYRGWVAYKHQVNQLNNNRQIVLKYFSVLKSGDLYHVQFEQNFHSSRINDTGKKHLYVVKEEQGYKIISERWEKIMPLPSKPSLQIAYKNQSDNPL
ncbi:L,D-transpeptidase family protein [Deltaproteobacteria bacterium TL4]